jgi:hypothetical protein
VLLPGAAGYLHGEPRAIRPPAMADLPGHIEPLVGSLLALQLLSGRLAHSQGVLVGRVDRLGLGLAGAGRPAAVVADGVPAG